MQIAPGENQRLVFKSEADHPKFSLLVNATWPHSFVQFCRRESLSYFLYLLSLLSLPFESEVICKVLGCSIEFRWLWFLTYQVLKAVVFSVSGRGAIWDFRQTVVCRHTCSSCSQISEWVAEVLCLHLASADRFGVFQVLCLDNENAKEKLLWRRAEAHKSGAISTAVQQALCSGFCALVQGGPMRMDTVKDDDFEPLILLLLPPHSWDYTWTAMFDCSSCSQGLSAGPCEC